MASTFTCLNYHVVFSTKYRKPRITVRFREALYQYMGGIVRTEKGRLDEIGGTEDHVHLLVAIPATVAVSDFVRVLKANTSKWVNERPDQTARFLWQTGYGAFSISASQLPAVRQYIQNQEEHHRKKTFKEEFLELLRRHNIEYLPEYVFEDPSHG